MSRTPRGAHAARLAVVGATTCAVVTAFAPPALATTTATSDPAQLLAAMLSPATVSLVAPTAVFETLPPSGTPTAVSDTLHPGFPSGGSYAVLTTGDATFKDLPNNEGSRGANNGGGAVRDGSERDVVILRIDFRTPLPQCTVGFTYQFLSEEFPEYVGSQFNDAFIAELDLSTWSAVGGVVQAPNAFVFESVNATPLSDTNATGTTYDGAKPTTGAAETKVSAAGEHSLYLSVFDLSDNVYDTAVFVDNLSIVC